MLGELKGWAGEGGVVFSWYPLIGVGLTPTVPLPPLILVVSGASTE